MQTQEIVMEAQITNLSLTEQMVFLFESFPEFGKKKSIKDYYMYTLVASCLADLFLIDKIVLQNNKIKIKNFERINLEFLEFFLRENISNRGNISIFDVFLSMNNQKITQLELMVKEELVSKKIFMQRREGTFIFGKKIYKLANKDLLKIFQNKLMNDTEEDKELTAKIVYLLILLQRIGFLPQLFESRKELEFGQGRLEQLIENDHIATMLLKAIENEIKLRELEQMSGDNEEFQAGRRF